MPVRRTAAGMPPILGMGSLYGVVPAEHHHDSHKATYWLIFSPLKGGGQAVSLKLRVGRGPSLRSTAVTCLVSLLRTESLGCAVTVRILEDAGLNRKR